ncbi:hypothetical protein EV696_102272 [Permianibacter aggregans]|uniref:Uncharacterized protein n=1 Tax=Permianibacter aggregans TaxID=1510150 RepID=A0A4R6UX63_9GAMM|nr:hypothetical protein EV696_102272 [Permianibacter aggregans]
MTTTTIMFTARIVTMTMTITIITGLQRQCTTHCAMSVAMILALAGQH